MPTKRKLDASDIATILAALRMFQHKYENLGAPVIVNDWYEFFANEECVHCQGTGGMYNDPCVFCEGTGVRQNPMPLGTEDIDTLCEQLNCGEVEL